MGDTLDLSEERVHLSEMGSSGFLLNNNVRALRKGAEFPSVYLAEHKDEYFIVKDDIVPDNEWTGAPDGGNHRTTLHYFMDLPLRYEGVGIEELAEGPAEKVIDRFENPHNLVSENTVEFDESALHLYFNGLLFDPHIEKNASDLELRLFNICTNDGAVSDAELQNRIRDALSRNPEARNLFDDLRREGNAEWEKNCISGV